jgi:acyl-CoA synthetase (AMP-forming)/AMP-acid ligase II
VKAVIELRPDAKADAEDLLAFCRARLGPIKTPKTLEIWKELPRSSVGKVLKRDIRARYWAGRGRAI